MSDIHHKFVSTLSDVNGFPVSSVLGEQPPTFSQCSSSAKCETKILKFLGRKACFLDFMGKYFLNRIV